MTIEELAAACQIFTFLTVRSDRYAVQCKTREGRTARVSLFSHLENRIGSKPHQTAQPPGDCRKVSSDVSHFCASQGALPKRPTNQPINRTNALICSIDRSGHCCRLFWRCCRTDGNATTASGSFRNPGVREGCAMRTEIFARMITILPDSLMWFFPVSAIHRSMEISRIKSLHN